MTGCELSVLHVRYVRVGLVECCGVWIKGDRVCLTVQIIDIMSDVYTRCVYGLSCVESCEIIVSFTFLY